MQQKTQDLYCSDCYAITDPELVHFYKSNSSINFDKAQQLLVDLLKNYYQTDDQYAFKDNLPTDKDSKCFAKLSSQFCSIAGAQNTITKEINLEVILNKINPLSEVKSNLNASICGDYIVLNPNKKAIIVENKISEINISPDVTKLFVESCKTQKSNGIFISQNSGIIGKNLFDIEFVETNVIVYIHNADYNETTIKMAFVVIDKISEKINMLNTDNKNIIISDESLCKIQNEYNQFIEQKEQLQNNIKMSQIQLIHQINNMKLLNLNDYLSVKAVQKSDKIYLYKCDLCNFYTSNTLKGMAAHKRGCKKNHHVN
jgi:hypothetical protein